MAVTIFLSQAVEIKELTLTFAPFFVNVNAPVSALFRTRYQQGCGSRGISVFLCAGERGGNGLSGVYPSANLGASGMDVRLEDANANGIQTAPRRFHCSPPFDSHPED